MRFVGTVTSLGSTVKAAGAKHWGAEELLGLAIVAALIALAYLIKWVSRQRRTKQAQAAVAAGAPAGAIQGADASRGGLLMGWDKRLSTSKTVATVWTFVVAYMVIVILLVALRVDGSAKFFSDTLSKASDLYLVFLGGPYAAAVIAKVNASSNASVQKSDGNGSIDPLAIISDDAGAINLYDFQYTLFNLVAIVAMILLFLGHPSLGLPDVPGFLATLTGGAALVYTTNKVANTNPPKLVSISPTSARVGEDVTLYGSSFLAPGKTDGSILVTIGENATQTTLTVPTINSGSATFAVPPAPGAASWPNDAAQTVKVATADAVDTGNGVKLRILADTPILESLSRVQVTQGDPLAITGRNFIPPDGAILPTVVARDPNTHALIAQFPGVAPPAPTDTTLHVTVPADFLAVGEASREVKITVERAGPDGTSNEVSLVVTS
jgi:hypothetical protein